MEHVAIAQALLDRDAPLAERLMREHLSHFVAAAERTARNRCRQRP
jgi:DNA-binding GntR family transcriptional regulator